MPAKLAYRVYQYLWAALDWIYPPQCGGCGAAGKRWCAACAEQTKVISAPLCPRCGQVQAREILCRDCQSDPPHFTALRSWAVYSGSIREAVHQLKYKRNVALGEVLARPLLRYLLELNWAVDMVMPVPLSLARLKERGYNQASLIAKPVALGLGVAYLPHGLARTRNTVSQVGLSSSQRKQNVANAFTARRDLVRGRKVLVVDDVTTTGSTMEACACALIGEGAASVFGLTLARAVLEGLM